MQRQRWHKLVRPFMRQRRWCDDADNTAGQRGRVAVAVILERREKERCEEQARCDGEQEVEAEAKIEEAAVGGHSAATTTTSAATTDAR